MQKLLRPTSCSAPLLSLSVGGTVTSSSTPVLLPFSFSLCLPSSLWSPTTSANKYNKAMAAAAAASSVGVGPSPSPSASLTAKKPFALSTLPPSSISRCLCLTHKHKHHASTTRAPTHRLPWLPSRHASLHSPADGSFLTPHPHLDPAEPEEVTTTEDRHGSLDELDTKEREKEKPLSSMRMNRRQRASSSPIPPNPDLLAIPGVGPRNLKKLVQKGIAGVAQLKQLYKDKVFLFFFLLPFFLFIRLFSPFFLCL